MSKNISNRASGAKPVAKKATTERRPSQPKVWVAEVGGYRIFGTPMRPEHFTEQQIEAAVAALE
jgi:hypothetical protein